MGSGVLTVRVSGETHALPAAEVAEIVRPSGWTRVPNAPPSLLGLANLRGAVLPVVSLAALLGHAEPAPSRTRRVVVAGKRERVGFLVDEVTALLPEGQGSTLDLDGLLARDFTRAAQPATRATTVRIAALAPEAEDDDVALVVLTVSGQDYALGLDQVSTILTLPASVTSVAGEDGAILGVIPWQDEILPLVCLATLLGLQPETKAALRIAVVPLGGMSVGLVAAGLDTIMRVPKRSIGPVPAVLTRGKGETRLEGICHVDGGRRLVCLLAPERLFDEATTRRILAQAGGGARMAEQRTGAGSREQFVLFSLGGERYGLPIAAVDEVVRRPANLTHVPRAPAFIEGVMNLRGRVIPVINQASRFASSTGQAGHRIMIVTIGVVQAGFAVDAVTGILTVDVDRLQPAPGFAGQTDMFDRVALEGEGGMTLLIDPAALLDQVEREMLAAIALGHQAA